MQKARVSVRNQHEINHFSTLDHIWWGALTPAGQKRYDNKTEMMRKMTGFNKNSYILEIGCGDGEFTKRIARFGPKIVATDITPKVIEKGRNTIKVKNITWKVEDTEKLSYKSNTFDIVCGVSILHHVNTKKALQECYRVLKPGGMLFFTEPNKVNPHIFLGLNLSILRNRMEFSPDETALIRWEMNEVLKQVGFAKVEVLNYDFLHPKTPPWMIKAAETLGSVLQKIPVIKEISGSLIVWAQK